MAVTIFEKQEKLGGVVRYAIPGFRIPEAAIDKDVSMIMAMGGAGSDRPRDPVH